MTDRKLTISDNVAKLKNFDNYRTHMHSKRDASQKEK